MYIIKGFMNSEVKLEEKRKSYVIAKYVAQHMIEYGCEQAVIYQIVYEPCALVTKQGTQEYE